MKRFPHVALALKCHHQHCSDDDFFKRSSGIRIFCTLRKFLISKIHILKEIGCALTLSAATQTTYSSLWVRWYDLKQCWVAREPKTQVSHCNFTYF